jgi:hypothetical protein
LLAAEREVVGQPTDECEESMANQETIRAAIRIDGNLAEGFALSFDAKGMIELMATFEKENSYGNGPAWEGIAGYLMGRYGGLAGIELQSEGDALLAECKTRAPLEKLQAILLELAADEQTLRHVIRDARNAGFGEGDL